MNLLPHLMRKDGRATWPAGLLVVLLSAALALLPMRGWATQEISWQILTLWLSLAAWLAVVILFKGLIRTDAALDSSRFIGTRPVSGAAVILSKMLVMLLAGLLPVVLAVMVRMLRTGVSVSVGDLGTVALANLGLLVALLGILTLPTVMPARGAWMDLLSVIAALILAVWGISDNVVILALDRVWYGLALGLGWAALTLLVAVYLRLKPLKALTACVLVAGSVALFANERVFSRGLRQTLVKSPVEVHLRPAEVSLRLPFAADDEGSLNVDVWVQGLPEGVFAECTSVSNSLTFEETGSVVKTGWPLLQANGWVVPPDCAYAVLQGDSAKPADSSQAGQHLSLKFGDGRFPSLKPPAQVKARLRGSLVLNLYRTVFDQALPFQEGLAWSGRDIRFKLNQVSVRENGIQMYVDSDILWLRSAVNRQVFCLGIQDYGFFGVDAGARELFRLESVGSEATLSPLLRHQQSQEITHVSLLRNWSPGVNGLRAKDPARPLRVDAAKISLGIFRRVKMASVQVPYDWTDVTVNVR